MPAPVPKRHLQYVSPSSLLSNSPYKTSPSSGVDRGVGEGRGRPRRQRPRGRKWATKLTLKGGKKVFFSRLARFKLTAR